MITNSKNNSFLCVEEICDEQIMHCLECKAQMEEKVHPFKKYLRGLWINIRLFLETNKWGEIVTLQMGDSHYTMKMDELEKRWRNQ